GADYYWQPAPLPGTPCFVVANTMVRHALAHGEYNVRRAESEELIDRMLRSTPGHRRLADLSVTSAHRRLADLSVTEVKELMRELPATLARRLRHIVAENRRVHEAYAALDSGNV